MRDELEAAGVRIDPVEWAVVYPAHVEPIGTIWKRADGFHAQPELEDLGIYSTGDAAVEAVWARFIEASAVRHEHASVTHGGRERHA